MSDRRFENLVDAHGRDVLNVALRVTRSEETAKDVHQEVFLAIWRRWDRYDDQQNWGAYLYRVTVRKALELTRRRQPVSVALDDRESQDRGSSPDIRLRLDELQQKLTDSLAKLPKRQAEVFVLSRIEGLDHAAIAEALGCSRNTVRVSLHRAIKQLARELRDYLS